MDFHATEFIKSADAIHQCPPDVGMEVAFVGRSNTGKSSVLNALTNQKVARVSKTPGRTQLINFFELTKTRRLVDLPGYGFAKVPEAMKEKWQRLLTTYILQRKSLRGIVIIMDIRHPMRLLDEMMIQLLDHANVAIHILLNKADKLSRNQQQQTLFQVKNILSQKYDKNISVQVFSALRYQGVEELQKIMESWLDEK